MALPGMIWWILMDWWSSVLRQTAEILAVHSHTPQNGVFFLVYWFLYFQQYLRQGLGSNQGSLE